MTRRLLPRWTARTRWPRAPSSPNHGNFVAGHCRSPGCRGAYGSSWHASNRLGSAESAAHRVEEAAVAQELLRLVEGLERAVRRQPALGCPPLLELRERVTVEHDRHRAVVHELDVHLRAEDARLDRHAERAQLGAEPLVERLRLLGRRGLREARPVALRGVRDQRELRDDEHRAATSETERSNRPSSSGKIRSRATLPASRAACSSPSPPRDAEEDAEAAADLAARA